MEGRKTSDKDIYWEASIVIKGDDTDLDQIRLNIGSVKRMSMVSQDIVEIKSTNLEVNTYIWINSFLDIKSYTIVFIHGYYI